MDRQEILHIITQVFNDTLDEENIRLEESSTADDIEGWDSLTHVQLVVAVEKKFKIRFAAKEIQGWKNVGELINSISSKI